MYGAPSAYSKPLSEEQARELDRLAVARPRRLDTRRLDTPRLDTPPPRHPDTPTPWKHRAASSKRAMQAVEVLTDRSIRGAEQPNPKSLRKFPYLGKSETRREMGFASAYAEPRVGRTAWLVS